MSENNNDLSQNSNDDVLPFLHNDEHMLSLEDQEKILSKMCNDDFIRREIESVGSFALTAPNSLMQDEQNRININEQQSCQPAVFSSTNQACNYAAQHQYENYPSCARGQPLYQNVQNCTFQAQQGGIPNYSNYHTLTSSSDYSLQQNCQSNTNSCYQPHRCFDNYQQLSTCLQGGIQLKPSCANNLNVTTVNPAQADNFAQLPRAYPSMKGKL